MKKLFANFSNKMRAPSSAPDSGGPTTAGYKVKKRKMENLHKAAWMGDVGKLRWHAMCNNDVNKVDKHNRTALHLACANGHAGVVDFLLSKQAKINLFDSQKRTALMKAVQCQNDLCVNILLENKADPDLMDADGNTALHLAAKIPSLSCVIMLVKKDADLNVKNLKGLSPLTMAVRGDHIAVTEFLLRKGADVNILDKHQRSPLMIAAANGQMDMVRMLLLFKADFTLMDNKGLSAEDHAVANGHRPCAFLITEHGTKRNQALSRAPAAVCDETIKFEPDHPNEALEAWEGPSTSKDGIFSPIAELVDARAEHCINEELRIQPKETDLNKWGLLLSKCEEESLEKLELMEELGLGQFDCNEEMDKSSNTGHGNLPACKEEFQPSPSLKEEVVYVSPKVPFALPVTISPDDTKVVASPTSPAHLHSPNVILQESDESDWDEDSLISFCNETKTDKQQLREALRGGGNEVSTLESDGKNIFSSDKLHQQEAALRGICNEKLSEEEEEEEEKSILSNVVQSFRGMFNVLSKSVSIHEEKQGDATSPYEESSDEEDVQSLRSVHLPHHWLSGSEDFVVESSGRALEDEKIPDCQLPGSEIIMLREVEAPPRSETPESLTKKKESSVDFATTGFPAGHDTADDTKVGPFHSIQLEEPEVAHETPLTMANLSAPSDAGGRASEGPTNEQPETRLADRTEPSPQVEKAVTSQSVESQLTHELSLDIRLDGQVEESQLEHQVSLNIRPDGLAEESQLAHQLSLSIRSDGLAEESQLTHQLSLNIRPDGLAEESQLTHQLSLNIRPDGLAEESQLAHQLSLSIRSDGLAEESQLTHQLSLNIRPDGHPEESQLAHQLTFDIRPDGQAEGSSQLTVVSEARGIRVFQSNGGICRDLFGFDGTLSDLSEDDRRWQSAEFLKRTPSTLTTTEDDEISKDTDDAGISEDSDIALHVRKLDAVTTDSRSKKNLWDFDERYLLKANGHHSALRERLRQLEIANPVLEQINMELTADVTNLTVQLTTAMKTIVSKESVIKKLEEDRNQAEKLLAQNHNTLNALHQKVNSQQIKQKETEEECKRSKSNEEQLRTELEVLQTDSSTKQRDLAEENEDLKDQVENLRHELSLVQHNENQNAMDWNNTITLLKYELKLATDRLEMEQQAHNTLAAEAQLTHSRLIEAERARSEMEKALLQEKDEHQRLASEVSCHREAVNKLSLKLSKMKAHANTMESDARRYEAQMVEKTMQLNSLQRESEQTALHVKELEAALQAEKELAARAASRQESTQEQLNQFQNEATLLRQRLEEAQSKAVANENALTEAQKSFNDTSFKVRADCEERVQQAQVGLKELNWKVTELETLVRKLEREKTERQTCQRQLQQELDDSLKKLSKCEASLEFSTRYRTDLEEEKTRLLHDIEKLKGKLQEREAQCIQAEKQMMERASLLDEREKELSIAARKQKEAQAAADASNDITKRLEEDVQRLELNNIRLEASAKQHANKFDALQKAAQEDARMRAQLEDLVTNLQSRKLTLEDQLSKEVQKHSVLSNSAQDTQLMWEEELKSRSKLGLRLAELEKEKNEIHTQVEMEKKKAEELAEQKRATDCRLEQEMKRNSEIQKESYRLQSIAKMAKRKLQDQHMTGADKEKLSRQVNELQAELEKEVSSRSQLERTKRQLEEELLSLRRSQGPPLDGGCLASAANAMGLQYRCHCCKALSPVNEGPSYSVEDYLAKMRQDLDEAMSRELANPSVKLDMSSACVSPVSRARQQYANVLKKNHEV
ncbi:ankyrin repeat domain-containing protein 26-like isoform X2 [Hippocampus comes]|uniref:ankyrin repeat domain-containing protein 26-like isoform X2 n=1 Tax=Hippocampus comes TaxID=109280 RepID=UPI00094E238D|nr:PREDICTED: ankyrin repeat domain-containing protein 26-like isoform X2 [Hippocampus comes]